MPNWLRQSTAADIGLGPFVDSTDGDTPETALTITAPDIRLKKNGGAWAQKNAAQTLSHEENGWYEVALDTVDTNTLGILIVAIHESGALAVWKEYMIVPANSYDSIVLGSDKLETDMQQINGDSIAADNAELFFDDTGFDASQSSIGTAENVNFVSSNAITSASLAASAGTEIGTAVWATAARTLTAATNITSTGSATFTQTGDSYAIVNSGTFGNAAIKGFVDDIGVAGAGLTAIPWNVTWNTNIFQEAENAITANFGFVSGNVQAQLNDISVAGVADLVAAVWGAATRSITSLGAGSITASSFAAGAIDAAAIAPDAIGASELAASAVSEIVAGMGGVGAFAITVTVLDQDTQALQNVFVTVIDGGGAVAGTGTTNASGQASLSLAAGTYTVALVKANYNFAPVSRTVTGNQAGSIVSALTMTIITSIPASGTPGMCVVAGYVKDVNGVALIGSTVVAKLVPSSADRPITSNGNVVSLEPAEATTNGLGYVSLELIRTDELDQTCTYTISCADADMDVKHVRLVTATQDIADL